MKIPGGDFLSEQTKDGREAFANTTPGKSLLRQGDRQPALEVVDGARARAG